MKLNDTTYELIHSLTKSEKRFFQLQSRLSGREKKNYLLVFDALEGMKTYDGKVLSGKLRGKKMNVSYEKKYLQEQLLRSLRNFHNGLTTATVLNDALRDIEILFKKRLNALCFARVRTALEIAEKYENYPALLALIDYESKLIARTGDYEKLWRYREEGYRKKAGALKMGERIAYAECLVFEATVIQQRKGTALSAGDRKKLQELRAELKRMLAHKEKSFLLEELCLVGLYLCTTISGQLKESYSYSRKTVELYWKNERQLSDKAGRFYASSLNLVNRCILLGKYDEGSYWVEKTKSSLEQLRDSATQEMYQELMPVIYAHALRICAASQDFAKGWELVKEFGQFEKNITVPLRANYIISMRVHMARICFGAGEYAKALQKLNQLINWKQTELQEDIVQFAYLFRLLVYYEMGKHELLESQLASVSRFFSGKWSGNTKGLTVCKMLDKMLRARTASSEAEALKEFKRRLQASIGADSIDHEYLDFIRWAEKRSGGRRA